MSEIISLAPEIDSKTYKLGKNGRMASNDPKDNEFHWINEQSFKTKEQTGFSKNFATKITGRKFSTPKDAAIIFEPFNNTLTDTFTILRPGINETGEITCHKTKTGTEIKTVHITTGSIIELPATCSITSKSVRAKAVLVNTNTVEELINQQENWESVIIHKNENIIILNTTGKLNIIEDKIHELLKEFVDTKVSFDFPTVITKTIAAIATPIQSFWNKLTDLPGNIIAMVCAALFIILLLFFCNNRISKHRKTKKIKKVTKRQIREAVQSGEFKWHQQMMEAPNAPKPE